MSILIDGVQKLNTQRVKENIVFTPGMPNTSRHPGSWHGLGIHWTGAENDSERVIRTLLNRELSVQFIIEKDGTIVQCADLKTQCAHIGAGNSNFLGVETVCRGFATKEDLALAKAKDPTLRDREDLDWAEARDTYRDSIGGKEVGMASFGPEQTEALLWLSETMAAYNMFPRKVPARKVTKRDLALEESPVDLSKYAMKHNGSLWLPAFDRQVSRTSPRVKDYRGVLGHFHVHATKYDPGTEIFYALWAEGWNPAGKKITGIR